MTDMNNKIKSHSQGKSLIEWLSYLENLHVTEIDLGLTRIGLVAEELALDFSNATVVTVAGTNGKGTTCAFLENALLAVGKSVAVYSSPHIESFNERLRIDKNDIADQPLINAFEKIELCRGDISLTYYEYTTLAALLILHNSLPDVILLEVGLGGRLDATNIIDADIAVITSIDLDHQAFLGETREKIGFEKAGIFRGKQFAVVGDPNTPESVIEHARSLDTNCQYRNSDFHIKHVGDSWQWQYKNITLERLLAPHIPIDNVATALTVLSELGVLPTEAMINEVISKTKVAGRTEVFQKQCSVMLDVAHNPHAARYLANVISTKTYSNVYAVFGMLSDKDITAVIEPLLDIVSHWYVGTLDVVRGVSSSDISTLLSNKTQHFDCFNTIEDAFNEALNNAKDSDLVLVFGSFYTVAEIRRLLV